MDLDHKDNVCCIWPSNIYGPWGNFCQNKDHTAFKNPKYHILLVPVFLYQYKMPKATVSGIVEMLVYRGTGVLEILTKIF